MKLSLHFWNYGLISWRAFGLVGGYARDGRDSDQKKDEGRKT